MTFGHFLFYIGRSRPQRRGRSHYGTAITIQEHHCVDYEEQPKPGSLTVTIEVQGGLVSNVYASPDLPEIRIELLDMDNAAAASPANLRWAERMLAATAAAHNHIY